MPPDPSSPTIAGWGRLPVPGREVRSEDLEAATRGAVLTRGLGRSYGDSSLPPPGHLEVVGSVLADRILGFDEATGVLRAEAGLSLAEMNRVSLPRGWFTPVTPGTRYVTLGGMVAADIHGKNHHVAGTFGRHVRRLVLRLAGRGGEPGEVVACSREERPELFRATLGGMGLTGHVLEVEVAMERVASPWIYAESERIDDLDRFLEALGEAARRFPYTVGWIDTLTRGRGMGRGILTRGRWAEPDEAPARPPRPGRRLTMPVELPGWVLSRPSVSAFNALYFHRHRPRVKRGVTEPGGFFYPLDAVRHWNRMYGRRGFTQHQCVLPQPDAAGRARRYLDLLTRLAREAGAASFLSVIKDCGEEGEGTLSFPRPGISIALDVPVREKTRWLVDRLNERVLEEGGRIYLAKDAFTHPEHFRAMEGERLERFREVKRRYDPEGRISSAQWERLTGEGTAAGSVG